MMGDERIADEIWVVASYAGGDSDEAASFEMCSCAPFSVRKEAVEAARVWSDSSGRKFEVFHYKRLYEFKKRRVVDG